MNSCIAWLVNEKDTPEQWGAKTWGVEDDGQHTDKFIGFGINAVEMVPPGKSERVTVALYGTGSRMPYVPKDPKLGEGEEEDLSSEHYLKVLIVHRKYKGHKLGERLIQMAKQEAKEKGKEVLRLDCYRSLEKDGVPTDGLVKYYERNGFKPVRPFTVWVESRQINWPGMLLEMKL
jgi:GNAT superfamily N-acetyltransferase